MAKTTPTDPAKLTPTEALTAMRSAAGLSQSELARRLDVVPAVVQRAENGNHAPRLDTFARWSRVTGVPVVIVVSPDEVSASLIGV